MRPTTPSRTVTVRATNAKPTKASAPVPRAPFTTGFCGPGPACKDVHRSCKHAIQNGSNATTPVIYCACSCHTAASTAMADQA
jgi:hypothetical protein